MRFQLRFRLKNEDSLNAHFCPHFSLDLRSQSLDAIEISTTEMFMELWSSISISKYDKHTFCKCVFLLSAGHATYIVLKMLCVVDHTAPSRQVIWLAYRAAGNLHSRLYTLSPPHRSISSRVLYVSVGKTNRVLHIYIQFRVRRKFAHAWVWPNIYYCWESYHRILCSREPYMRLRCVSFCVCKV